MRQVAKIVCTQPHENCVEKQASPSPSSRLRASEEAAKLYKAAAAKHPQRRQRKPPQKEKQHHPGTPRTAALKIAPAAVQEGRW